MLPAQRYQRAPAYHVSWTSSDTARLSQGALHCEVALSSGRSVGRDWRRRPGRRRARWTDQLRQNTSLVPASLWRQAVMYCEATVERSNGPS